MNAIRRPVTALLLALTTTVLAGISVAAGGNPGKQPLPTPPDVVTDTCGAGIGQVLLHITVNREFTKIFVEKDGTIKMTVNGASFASVTRLSTGKSVTLNISGPGYILFKPDGQVVGQANGLFLDINPPPSGGIWLYKGNVQFDPLTGQVLNASGQVTGVCQLLS